MTGMHVATQAGLLPIDKGEQVPSRPVRLVTWDAEGKSVVSVEDVASFLKGGMHPADMHLWFACAHARAVRLLASTR
jgi:hypothetical protein